MVNYGNIIAIRGHLFDNGRKMSNLRYEISLAFFKNKKKLYKRYVLYLL